MSIAFGVESCPSEATCGSILLTILDPGIWGPTGGLKPGPNHCAVARCATKLAQEISRRGTLKLAMVENLILLISVLSFSLSLSLSINLTLHLLHSMVATGARIALD